MKQGIHPEYVEATVHCSCGETFTTRATKPEIRIEICSKCHPFYSGKQKLVDTGGRVQRFQKKYGEYKAPEKSAQAEDAQAEDAQAEDAQAEDAQAEPEQAEPEPEPVPDDGDASEAEEAQGS